jgi:S-adenosylmethionine:tRNA ribosyltransferase-isomerase
MHSEWYSIDDTTAAHVNTAKNDGRRIIAVGTTALRALESAAVNGAVQAGAKDTKIFITPGYEFQIVDGLMTNFHLPRSTLFMLVSALCGLDVMKRAYAHAIEKEYRFYSYGDSSLLWKAQT